MYFVASRAKGEDGGREVVPTRFSWGMGGKNNPMMKMILVVDRTTLLMIPLQLISMGRPAVQIWL